MNDAARDGAPLNSDMDVVFEQRIANMTGEEFDQLVLRARPPQEISDPKARAAHALRRELGVEQRGRSSKQKAADALRRYATGR